MKRLIVGDIQGCYTELQDLLDASGLSTEDEIIALGDIVDRGPDSPGVFDFFANVPNARTLMGNHERKHVRSFYGFTRPALSQLITRRQFGEERYREAVTLMEPLPRFIDFPEAVLVHAFFEPNVPLSEQRETVIVGTLSGEAYLKGRYNCPWYELYRGNKPVIVGHHNYSGTSRPFIHRDLVYGLDTGCCFGGALTGLILPDFRIVSVPSRKNYWKEMKTLHADKELAAAPEHSLSWEQITKIFSVAEKQLSLPHEARERIERLRCIVADGDRAIRLLFDHILETNARILSRLEQEHSFHELSSQEQGRIYAAWIGKTPLAEFLHRARKGGLTLEGLRKRFKTPAKVTEFVARSGLQTKTPSI